MLARLLALLLALTSATDGHAGERPENVSTLQSAGGKMVDPASPDSIATLDRVNSALAKRIGPRFALGRPFKTGGIKGVAESVTDQCRPGDYIKYTYRVDAPYHINKILAYADRDGILRRLVVERDADGLFRPLRRLLRAMAAEWGDDKVSSVDEISKDVIPERDQHNNIIGLTNLLREAISARPFREVCYTYLFWSRAYECAQCRGNSKVTFSETISFLTPPR